MKTPRVVESTTRSNQVNEPHQVAVAICLIFTVILLQKITFSMKSSIPRLKTLSNSVTLQTSHPCPREQNYESEWPRQIPVQEAYMRSGHEIFVGG